MTKIAAPTRTVPPLLMLVLALMAAAAPLSINMYLAGLPQLGEELRVNEAGAQLTLTFFLVGMATGQLVAGPLSDSRGRKKIIVAGAIGMVVMTTLAAVAPSIGVLYAARLFQGLAGGAAVVLARTAVVDMVRGPEVARVFSLLMVIGGLAPVIGPVLGGFIVDPFGWRGIFWLLLGINVVMLLGALFVVPETLPVEERRPASVRVLWNDFRGLVSDRPYLGFTLSYIFSFGTMFAYVSASAYVLQSHYGVSPLQYSLIFATNGLGMFVAGLLNARLVRSIDPLVLARVGNAGLVLGALGLLVTTLADGPLAIVLVLLFLVVTSMGLNMANNSALAMGHSGKAKGLASALLGAGQFAFAGVLSPLVGVAAAIGFSLPVAMASVMVLTSTAAAIALYTAAAAHNRRKAEAEAVGTQAEGEQVKPATATATAPADKATANAPAAK